MNFHLIDGVVEVAAGIPNRRGRLDASLGVAGARLDNVIAALGCIPVVAPQAPGIVRLLAAELRGIPTPAAVGGNFDFGDVRFAGPGHAVNLHRSSFYSRAVTGTAD